MGLLSVAYLKIQRVPQLGHFPLGRQCWRHGVCVPLVPVVACPCGFVTAAYSVTFVQFPFFSILPAEAGATGSSPERKCKNNKLSNGEGTVCPHWPSLDGESELDSVGSVFGAGVGRGGSCYCRAVVLFVAGS